ncbi:MAG: hypothetical protein R6U19_00905 [Bacteroidales bacterium]
MNYKVSIASIVIPAILLYLPLYGQSLKLETSLDTSVIRIGEQTVFRLSAELDTGDHVQWPVIKDTLSRNIEIVNQEIPDTSNPANGVHRISYAYTITSFDSGYHVIPPLLFRKDKDSLFTEPLLLEVKTMAVDTTKAFRPVKDIRRVPVTFGELLPYITGGILLILLALLIYYYLRKRKRKASIYTPPKKPQIPPAEEAFQRLEQLEQQKLWQNNKPKQYYIELTAIVRHYIERRFGVESEELSSRETLEQLKDQVPAKALEKLRGLLELADLVKFARLTPHPEENTRSGQSARIFVELTDSTNYQTNKQDKLSETGRNDQDNKDPDHPQNNEPSPL